jgi:hypothetical protein
MFKIIDELQRVNPKRRQTLIMRTHANNIAYFKKTNPDLAEFIELHGTGKFGISITDTSIEVFDRQTKQLYHPPGELFSYMSDLGSLHHTAWVDKMVIEHVWRGEGEHGKRIHSFLNGMYGEFAGLLRAKLKAGVVRLPSMKDGRHYSGPVVFLGIFTGLHIMYYLNRTAVRDVFLIEPDLDRFALSCFFLDYQHLENNLGRLLLHVGPNAPQFPIDNLIGLAPITAASWVRLLPAYPDGQFDDIINRVGLRWTSLLEIFVPIDREIKNLANGLQNIRAKLPLLHRAPNLSSDSVIAVVASGPSLDADLAWLKENRDRMIVFASISCVRVLRENGITPDFQCTLDTEIDEPLMEKLQLDPEVPLVAYYKIDPALAGRFKKTLLLHEDHKANAVRFLHSFGYTHPTTGNLMAAVAAWCKPSQLLFLGLDLGYRDPKLSHVQGGWHDDNAGSGHDEETADREHIPVVSNFTESEGEILTMSYYNVARGGVEMAIAPLVESCRILNLADGARIKGAQPLHSSTLTLPSYSGKRDDIQALEGGFSSEYNEIFEAYETPGRQLVDEMLESVMKKLEMPGDFRWPEFTIALDSAYSTMISDCISRHREFRIEVFGKLVMDLLCEWFRTLVLAEDPETVERVYRKGLKELRETLSTLPWPEELDAMMPIESVDVPNLIKI